MADRRAQEALEAFIRVRHGLDADGEVRDMSVDLSDKRLRY